MRGHHVIIEHSNFLHKEFVQLSLRTDQCINEFVYTDQQSGLMWVKNGTIIDKKMTHEEAFHWVRKLNYCGFNDWRLPSKCELNTLAARGDGKYLLGFINIQSDYYWSFDNCGIVMNGRGAGFEYKTTKGYVLPVRRCSSVLDSNSLANVESGSLESDEIYEFDENAEDKEIIPLSSKGYISLNMVDNDNVVAVLQQKIQQLGLDVAELKSSFSHEISALQQEVAELKQQVNRTGVQHSTAPVDVSGLLSPQDIATIINSPLWEEFNSSLLPSKLFSNFLWEKAQAVIPLERFGQIKVCDLAKQLKLPNIADTDLTIGHCLSLSYYDFINTSPDQILNPVFLCIAALIALVDSQKPDTAASRQEIEELPTVVTPSSDVYIYAIPHSHSEISDTKRMFIFFDEANSEKAQLAVSVQGREKSDLVQELKERFLSWCQENTPYTVTQKGSHWQVDGESLTKHPIFVKAYNALMYTLRLEKGSDKSFQECVEEQPDEHFKEPLVITLTEIPVAQTTAGVSVSQFAELSSLAGENGLDLSRIQFKQQETEKVSQLLGNIFADEDNAEDSAESVQSTPPSEYSILLDLDEIHSAFLYVLATKSIWKRDELEKVASGRRLLACRSAEHH